MLTTFGHLLKNHRLNRGMTQQQLAAPIGINGSYIARLERDERRPSRRVILDMALVLDLTDTERDQLLAAAQHLPEGDMQRLMASGGVHLAHPTIVAVSAALQDHDLDAHQRELLSQEITAYVLFRQQQIKHQELVPA